MSTQGDRIGQGARLEHVRYANVWEDADVLCEALQPAPGKRVLSIASGGDNCFALAEAGADVVAVDLSDAQLALLELKRTAIRALDYPSLLAFLGIWPASNRLDMYARIGGGLPAFARAFWDARPDQIRDGIVHAGKFERYLATFRRRVVPLLHDRGTVHELLREKDRRSRIVFYETRWDNWRWRLTFRVFFSRRVMGLMRRDPEYLHHVEGSAADRVLRRTEYALTELPTHTNPYLHFIFTGEFGVTLPRYLAPERFLSLRDAMSRIIIVRGSVEHAAQLHAPFDGFNLSHIFEYLDPLSCAAIYRTLVDAARPGARVAYWNLLVPRQRPDVLAERVRTLRDDADALFARDRAFFYSAFVLEEVQ